jgi:hypothetical protein
MYNLLLKRHMAHCHLAVNGRSFVNQMINLMIGQQQIKVFLYVN